MAGNQNGCVELATKKIKEKPEKIIMFMDHKFECAA